MSDDKNMLDVVRIKTPAGVERNATRAEAKRTGAKIIDSPTHDGRGRPVPEVVGKPEATPAPAPAPTPKSIDKTSKEA